MIDPLLATCAINTWYVDEIEKPLILKTLKYFKGNQIKTAKVLGINRNTLRSKITKHNLPKKFSK